MKWLRDQFDAVEPHFEEGGKLHKLYPMYEATDTLLFTPKDVTKTASHVRDGLDLKRMVILIGSIGSRPLVRHDGMRGRPCGSPHGVSGRWQRLPRERDPRTAVNRHRLARCVDGHVAQ